MESNKNKERGIIFKTIVIILFSLLFSIVIILCMEGLLRFFYRDVLSTADGTSYFSLKNQHLFVDEHNAWRFRGKHFDQMPDERYRLVVAGDSFTYGQGTYPATNRFTEQLDLLLNATNNNLSIEVVNIGICGFNLQDHIKFLHFVDAIKPDYVLYQWFVNDMVDAPDYSKFRAKPLVKNRERHIWLWQHSAFYYLLQRWYGNWQRSNGSIVSYSQYLVDLFADPKGKPAKDAQEKLERLIDHHQKNSTAFGIVLFPACFRPMNEYRLGFLHEQVLEVCRKKDVQCLDLRDAYRGIEPMKLWANKFDPHPGSLAHKIAADYIYNFFVSDWKMGAQEKMKKFSHGNESKNTTKGQEQ